MRVTFNGESTTTRARTVAGLVGDEPPRGIAIARNGVVVPRTEWERTSLSEDDTVEIVTAVQGG